MINACILCVLLSLVSVSKITAKPFSYNSRSIPAFTFPSLDQVFANFNPASSPSLQTQKCKSTLLQTISGTNNGKDASPELQSRVLSMVNDLETNVGVPNDLLTNVDLATDLLDGVWYLQYTSPSIVDGFENEELWNPSNPTEGSSNIPTNQVTAQGSVAASAITVDTSNKVVKQSFDIQNSRVQNDVELDFGDVTVGGSFRISETVPNRAVVSFDTVNLDLGFVTLELGWLFNVIGTVKGTFENGWLETTFVDEEIRIGRGNKGTMFILTRDKDALDVA